MILLTLLGEIWERFKWWRKKEERGARGSRALPPILSSHHTCMADPSQGFAPIMSVDRTLTIPTARARVMLGWWLQLPTGEFATESTQLARATEKAKFQRLDGNAFFRKKKSIGAIIDACTEAITLCPNIAVYWTNRALCYQKRKEWTKVEEDCKKALELDKDSVKAHYMLGLALLERQEYAGGVKELEKAFDLGRGTNPVGCMVEEIWQTYAQAKYMEWEHSSSKRSWRLQNVKETCEKALAEYHFLGDSQADDASKDAANDHAAQLELLNEVFSKAALADTPTQVPDYLCCKITLDIFRDPVITPSGVTYERAVLLEHLKQVGKFDPLTREPLEQHQLVPNLAIKQAVQVYLNEHGWAYKTS